MQVRFDFHERGPIPLTQGRGGVISAARKVEQRLIGSCGLAHRFVRKHEFLELSVESCSGGMHFRFSKSRS